MVFDSKFTLSDYVSQIISSTRVHARDFQRICLLPDLKASVHLANALVSSRLDYCNSLFVSLTDFELRKLQLVQISICRVVAHFSKFSHIIPQFKKTPLAPSQVQETIQNRPHYIQNSEPRSTSLSKCKTVQDLSSDMLYVYIDCNSDSTF